METFVQFWLRGSSGVCHGKKFDQSRFSSEANVNPAEMITECSSFVTRRTKITSQINLDSSRNRDNFTTRRRVLHTPAPGDRGHAPDKIRAAEVGPVPAWLSDARRRFHSSAIGEDW